MVYVSYINTVLCQTIKFAHFLFWAVTSLHFLASFAAPRGHHKRNRIDNEPLLGLSHKNLPHEKLSALSLKSQKPHVDEGATKWKEPGSLGRAYKNTILDSTGAKIKSVLHKTLQLWGFSVTHRSTWLY